MTDARRADGEHEETVGGVAQGRDGGEVTGRVEMTKDEILQHIADSQSVDECREIQHAAHARVKALETAAYKARVDEYWSRISHWKPGQTVYCCAEGTFLGGPLQRGDEAKVYAIQPRKKMLWLTIGKRKQPVGFPASQVYRYKLRANPPDNPMSQVEREMADRAGEVFDRIR